MLEFVIPDLHGPPTGGTLYNRGLVDGLRRAGLACRVGARPNPQGGAECVWIDTLFLPELPTLAAAVPRAPVGLLTHYLPSLVRHGERPSSDQLGSDEQAALRLAHRFVVPSGYVANELANLGIPPRRVRIVEPGFDAPMAASPHATEPVRAIMVANVVAAKGVEPLLAAMVSRIRPDDRIELTIVGSLQAERDVAAAAIACMKQSSVLDRAVEFRGPLSADDCIKAIAKAHVMVSASTMESFGMALAEARSAGLPIVARGGGHTFAHVDPAWGGIRCEDATGVAEALLDLVRDRAELERRCVLARAHRIRRTWDEVARAFAAPWHD